MKVDFEKYFYKAKDIWVNNKAKINYCIKKEKTLIISIVILILFPIFVSCLFTKTYEKKVRMAKIEKIEKAYPRNSFDATNFMTATYPILNDVVLIGDSYAHFVSYDLGFDLTNYSCPGLKLEHLKMCFDAALGVNKKYAVIFIGPNDFIAKTELADFSSLLGNYISQLKRTMGCKVILCTYLPSMFTHQATLEKNYLYTIDEYNEEIMSLENKENDIYYLDLMSLAGKSEYFKYSKDLDDKIHFNKKFNIAFINKLYDLILDIEENEIIKNG